MEHSRDLIQTMHDELHDLCQPLTALQVQLEVGKMLGDQVALREAVEAGLEEVNRLSRAIQHMRDRLLDEGGGPRHDVTARDEEFGGHAAWRP